MDSSLFFRSHPSNVTPLLLPKHKSLQSNNWSISVPCCFSRHGSWIQKLLELLAATRLVWMWRPAGDATVRLRTTKGDSWRRCIDATPSVKAELENTFPWKKCTDWRWRRLIEAIIENYNEEFDWWQFSPVVALTGLYLLKVPSPVLNCF